MAKSKMVENSLSVADFIHLVKDEKRRSDCFTLIEMLKNKRDFNQKCGDQVLLDLEAIIISMKADVKGIVLILLFLLEHHQLQFTYLEISRTGNPC